MDKKIKNLLFYFLVFGVVFGVLLFINSNKEKETYLQTTPLPEQKFIVSNDGTVKEMVYDREGDVIKYVLNDDGMWVVEGKENIPLNSTKLENMAKSFTKLESNAKVLDKAKNLEEYGLDKPKAILTGTLDDGSDVVINVGDEIPSKVGYYVMVQGDPALYSVDKLQLVGVYGGLNEVMDKAVSNVNPEELQYVYIKEKGKNEIEAKLEEKMSKNDKMSMQYGFSGLNLEKPIKGRKVYTDALFQQYLSPLNSLQIGDLVEEYPGDMSKYGLDDPKITVVVKDANNSIEFSVGNSVEGEEGFLYCKLGDKPFVFEIDKKQIEILNNIDVFKFIDRFVAIESMEDVSSIKMEGPTGNHEITINQEKKLSQKEGEQDRVVYKAVVDGKNVDMNSFENFYNKLIGLSYDNIIDESDIGKIDESKEPVITITYSYNDGRPDKVCKYYNYNDNFYTIKGDDGISWFAINKQAPDYLFENWKKF